MRKMMPIRIVGKYVWSVWKLWRGGGFYLKKNPPQELFLLKNIYNLKNQGQTVNLGG